MPKSVSSAGTNSQGNSYTSYSDGSYRYSNSTGGGGGSSYYGTSSGGFYSDNAGYSSYSNSNTGTSWSKQK